MSKPSKRILVTHAPPVDDNSPYHQLQQAHKVQVEFRPFIEIQGVATPEFRKQGINPLDYTAVIFTSKHSVDHFFRICKELRVELPAETKYFCVSDATAKYLQKYIVVRKRKLFVGDRTPADLVPLFKKHASEKYLFPTGETTTAEVSDFMIKHNYSLKEAMVYQTVYCRLKDLSLDKFDMVCFFSPQSISSLWDNFPGYAQNGQLVAVFGKATAKAAEGAGLRVDIEAPRPEAPSMTMAIDAFLSNS